MCKLETQALRKDFYMFTVLNGYFGVVSVNFRLQEKSCVKKGKLTTDVVVKFFGKVFYYTAVEIGRAIQCNTKNIIQYIIQ
jgi:hypothetical protein